MKQFPGVPALALTLLPALLVLVVVALAKLIGDVAPHNFLRDTNTLAGAHPLMGMVSNLGLMLWAASAAVSLLTASFLMRTRQPGIPFFLASGALSLWLLLDDAFLFHESLAPDYLGLSDKVVILALGLAVLTWIAAFRRTILQSGAFFLALAMSLFAMSLLVDSVSDVMPGLNTEGGWRILFEDGPKWLGICCWLAFHVTAALAALDPRPDQSR